MYLAYINNNKYTLWPVKYGLCLENLTENILEHRLSELGQIYATNNENWAKEAADFQSVKGPISE